MCKAIEDMRRESEKIGEMKTLLASIRHLMENTQWSASKAMDMLGVPKSEQELYRSKI